MRRNYDDDQTDYEIRRLQQRPQTPQDRTRAWFGLSGIRSMQPSRLAGVDSEWLLGELVRRPGDSSRNAATTMTTREGDVDQTPPGAGEWHGSQKLRQGVGRRQDRAPDYVEPGRRYEDQMDYEQAMDDFDAVMHHARSDAYYRRQLAGQFLSGLLGSSFEDRRDQGRRYTSTDNTQGRQPARPRHQEPPVDPARFLSY
jgi:hypothetical protein